MWHLFQFQVKPSNFHLYVEGTTLAAASTISNNNNNPPVDDFQP